MKNKQIVKIVARKPKALEAKGRILGADKPLTKANEALRPQVTTAASFADAALRKVAFYADDDV